jgi:exodeoxyribonuclease-3
MKVISCNLNGIRSAYKKGLLDFIARESPDVICFQEVKAGLVDFPDELLTIDGYNLYLNSAVKKGYSGVAVYSKLKPVVVDSILGFDRFDNEGRFLELEYPGLTILNLYFPHGGRQKENLDYKLDVYRMIMRRLKDLKNKNVMLVGDFNIAHKEIDLARPKQNKNNIMFSEIERLQIDKLLDLGFTDSFRYLNKDGGNYTWWPYAFNAKERNMGWRIDYCFVSKELFKNIKSAKIYSDVVLSDHCPVGIELI